MSTNAASDPAAEAEITQLRQRVAELERSNNDLRQTLVDLQQREASFREFVEETDDLITQVDATGTFVYVNRAIEKLLGYTVAEWLGRPAFDIIHPDDQAATQLAFGNWITNHATSVQYENRLVSRTGASRPMLWTINLHYDPAGNLSTIKSIARDISARKHAEELNQRLGRILDNSANEIYVFAADTLRFTQVNAGARQNLGYTMDELATMTAVDIKPRMTYATFAEVIAPLHAGHTDFITFETIHQRKDGSTYPVDVRLHLSRTEDPPVFVAIIQDTTGHKQVENELRMLKSLVEAAPDIFAACDMNGIITYANPAFRTSPGYGDATIGMHVTEFYMPETVEQVPSIIATIQTQGTWKGEMVWRCQNGDTFIGAVSAFLVRDAAGTPLCMASITRDITADLQQEEERQALQQQVIAAQQAALRELSTPLIPLADNVLAMPLIGTIDSARAQQIMETLLEGVASHQAQVAILDITGVQMVDTQVANALIRAAQAVKLLGAQVILTGIRPHIAQTLVQLGVDLSGIVTRSSLQAGIAYALGQ